MEPGRRIRWSKAQGKAAVWGAVVAVLLAGLIASEPAAASAKLSGAERRALTIVSVKASGAEPAGLMVTVTFAGNVERALGHGHLKNGLVAVILQPKSSGFTTADLLTEGPGPVGRTLSRTRSRDVGVVRNGNQLFFFVGGPGSSHVGHVIVKAFAALPNGHAASDLAPPNIWAEIETEAAQDERLVAYLDTQFISSGPSACEDAQGYYRYVSIEVSREGNLQKKLTELRDQTDRLIRHAATPDVSEFRRELDAYLQEKLRLTGRDLRKALRLVDDYLQGSLVMSDRLKALRAKFAAQVEIWCSRPTLTPIRARFTPPPPNGVCNPPACTTVYTEATATPQYGGELTYSWSLSIPDDPDCAKGFLPNSPAQNQAKWYHADASQGGTCNHSGNNYDASGYGHPGTVTVVVTNDYWSCTATYYGTQGANGAPTGDGPKPQACEPLRFG